MSQKEAKRAQVIELLTAGKIDQKEAGKRLAVSVRQITINGVRLEWHLLKGVHPFQA